MRGVPRISCTRARRSRLTSGGGVATFGTKRRIEMKLPLAPRRVQCEGLHRLRFHRRWVHDPKPDSFLPAVRPTRAREPTCTPATSGARGADQVELSMTPGSDSLATGGSLRIARWSPDHRRVAPPHTRDVQFRSNASLCSRKARCTARHGTQACRLLRPRRATP